ncbi:MAG TPA: YhbY family RNA-binding protein, partial [Casimicrobiaceae bacterium]|nr:YhbY family RNA-binding protein [Casimicrobiaceae bacterium]
MRTLPPPERRALRAKAHTLHPVVIVGHHGLTPAVLKEIDTSLRAHELIKVRVADDDRAVRDEVLRRICSELDAAPVQHLGKLLIVWRPQPEDDAPTRPVAADKKSTTKGRPRRPSAEPAPRASKQARSGAKTVGRGAKTAGRSAKATAGTRTGTGAGAKKAVKRVAKAPVGARTDFRGAKRSPATGAPGALKRAASGAGTTAGGRRRSPGGGKATATATGRVPADTSTATGSARRTTAGCGRCVGGNTS